MKIYTGIITILLVLGLLVIPGMVAAEDNTNTDPNLDNNQANVTVDPYAVEQAEPVTKKTIPLQKTGIPVAGMLTAALMIFAGMGISKRQ